MAVFAAFTEADIKLAAGLRSFERGLDYLDQVEDLEIASTQITATVWGSSGYTISLTFGEAGLGGHCTCPQGRDGFFCSICVAVGLAVLKMGEDLPRHIEAARVQRQVLDSWLESLSKEELLAELSGLLDEDRDLRRRFELRAASENLDAVTVRRAVRELVALPRRGYVEYDEAYRYASEVLEAAAAIDDLILAWRSGRRDRASRARRSDLPPRLMNRSTTLPARSPTPGTNCWRFTFGPARPHRLSRSRWAATSPNCCCMTTTDSHSTLATTPTCSATKASLRYASASGPPMRSIRRTGGPGA